MSRRKPSLLLADPYDSPEEIATKIALQRAQELAQAAQARSELLSRTQEQISQQSNVASTQRFQLLESLHVPTTQEDIRRANSEKPILQPGENQHQFEMAMHNWRMKTRRSEEPTTAEIVHSMHSLSEVQRSGGAAVNVAPGPNPDSKLANVRRFQ